MFKLTFTSFVVHFYLCHSFVGKTSRILAQSFRGCYNGSNITLQSDTRSRARTMKAIMNPVSNLAQVQMQCIKPIMCLPTIPYAISYISLRICGCIGKLKSISLLIL
ncbi:unnamed protein product [Clavelina lepadiformis]|uniref:Secreted protein n=1 Tax=Clavelina lepadiformis TaxID=159417 RepID=A0ABP0G1T1_CLALP